jgi:hypothetical protein
LAEDDQKQSEYYQAAIASPCIDFIVRLLPPNADLPIPEFEADGGLVWEFRKPERCPLGIPALK